ncbi:hypothetical protein JQ596_16650 [Bradyrhizobium manausense]|uniref:hypothetical protein n=1 Tax=Bradyrhizobium manausense TaxID=989370 RepID=UPI001BACDA92|nr:hypothetical protein [Bradyrhizobium manausense]MBR0827167.1 hypothetical protein [Bradyrhizobium manausense]
MNHSIYTADKASHLKVVVSVLLASIAIVATTLTARLTHPEIDLQKATTQTVYEPRSNHALSEIVQRDTHPI